ncbi:hypothetical protein GKE82_21955 [Conexibacter sp. W3-3-2]|uniref:Uncharacterized protein n=1 Tax=Paraconexibacter algicola TaxID=2133960 RepID=A0A2T4UFI1_9ACTN|nr:MULTISPECIES: hypothetical protein [Solirubrobacterales]MTD46880.1 hypothetical protein [Conexibacter sp. W3-3-2]PTL56546.1 hypothetical protein C7Y72_16485 [Paraconexibacter algicola]
MSAAPADRLRTLLLRADNLLKNTPDATVADDRAERAREALLEAREVARDPSVDDRVRDLVERRLAALSALTADADG